MRHGVRLRERAGLGDQAGGVGRGAHLVVGIVLHDYHDDMVERGQDVGTGRSGREQGGELPTRRCGTTSERGAGPGAEQRGSAHPVSTIVGNTAGGPGGMQTRALIIGGRRGRVQRFPVRGRNP